jgi:cytidine deaminase
MQAPDLLWSLLIVKARAASRQAYCPYSGFAVGCAVATESHVYVGCNVENASYGVTICAERCAICCAAAQGDRHIRRLVIYTATQLPAAPCGACRQVINEFNPDAEVLCVCDSEQVLQARLADLLPAAFGPANVHEVRLTGEVPPS